MKRAMNVHRALELCYGLDEAEREPISSSPSEEEEEEEELSEAGVSGDDRDKELEPCTRSPAEDRSPPRCRSPHARSHPHLEPWRTEKDPDTVPQVSRFTPHRPPGAQVDTQAAFSPLHLFQLYFSPTTMSILCRNTNKFAAKNIEIGKKYKWADVEVEELYKFLGLLIYTSLVSLPSIVDYWKQNKITSVPFPATVMARDRFRALLWNIHPSDPQEDQKNDEKKGTAEYDKLFRIKPLMDDILIACQAYYHPRKELTIDERLKDKPTRWGIKLFALADSSNGYTVNFNICIGKTRTMHGLSYDAVMNLVHPSYLGSGYHIYVDDFYTSPRLFLDLASMKFGACGTYRDNRKGCPSGRANALSRKAERGSVRWIREGPLVFVKWMDTQEVSVCSTIHPAVSGQVVKRRVKEKDGHWAVKNISCPTPVIAYNKNMSGVDLSDQLLQYYSAHRRTARWYRSLFLHLVDIATTNAFILHCDISTSNHTKSMSYKDFRNNLVSQLCGVDSKGKPTKRSAQHIPVAIATATDASRKATQGRRICQRCHQVDKKRFLTPWKCKCCDVALCVILDRNCFAEWHR